MKRMILIVAVAMLSVACHKDPVKDAIALQLLQYPESRVQDIYKNFCQDNLGPGHLIPNPESARAYLMEELQQYREDLDKGLYKIPRAFYVPLGDKSNFIRVDLSVILNSQVSVEKLLNAFVRSANEGKIATEDEWKAKWTEVAAVIRRDFMDIPDAEKDLATIDSLMAEGELILHHSAAFESAYHPHYRIVAKEIFGRDLF